MNIVIVGAGGLGGLVGASLHEAGHGVHLVARGAHLEALRDRGLKIVDGANRTTLRIPCSAGDQLPEAPDLAFVTVKAHALPDVAPMVTRMAQAGAWIIPLVNGVDAVQRLADLGVPSSRLSPGVAYLTAFRIAPGTVERKGSHQRLSFGSLPAMPDGRHPLVAAFEKTTIQVDISDDIQVDLWSKMAVVCALAAVCGATGSALGGARQTPTGRRLQEGVVAEVVKVGRSRGVAMDPDTEVRTHAILDAFDDTFFPSLLHDLRQGQPTEVDALTGAISAMGQRVGIPTPSNDYATEAIRAAERAAAR